MKSQSQSSPKLFGSALASFLASKKTRGFKEDTFRAGKQRVMKKRADVSDLVKLCNVDVTISLWTSCCISRAVIGEGWEYA